MRLLLMGPLLAALLGGCTSGSGLASTEMRAHEPSLAVTPAATWVAWHGGQKEESSIFIQKLDHRDRPTGIAIAVNDGDGWAYEPDLIPFPGGLAITWYEKNPANGELSAWLAGLSESGQRKWLAPLTAQGAQARNPVVRMTGDSLSVAWIEQPEIDDGSNTAAVWSQRFSLNGMAVDRPRRIGTANRNTWNLNATVDQDRLVIVYDAALGSQAHELQMIVVGDHLLHRTLSEDDGYASLYPDLQVSSSGQGALTWFDERDGNQEIYLLAAPFETLAAGRAPRPRRISHTEASSIGAYVAWNADMIGLAWVDILSDQREVFTQTFSTEGAPVTPQNRPSTGNGNAGVPAIRASGTGFLVAWNDYVIEAGAKSHMSVSTSRLRFARLSGGE